MHGRQRHLLVDTLGLLLRVQVLAAAVQDWEGARVLLAGLEQVCVRLRKRWGDQASAKDGLPAWVQARLGWVLESVAKREGQQLWEQKR